MQNIVATNLAKIAGLKCLIVPKETYIIWYEQIKQDIYKGIIDDVQKGFDFLLKEKSYGGLDYSVFLEGAKKEDNSTEEAWQECLMSARQGGRLPISARAGKVLNSFGGMEWLKNVDKNGMHFHRKDFIEAYKTMPEPKDTKFKCIGLEADMYLAWEKMDIDDLVLPEHKEIKQLEE